MDKFKKAITQVQLLNDVTVNTPLRKTRPLIDPAAEYDHLTPAQMLELDEQGWAPIHHAVNRGILSSLDKFVTTNKQLLELRTGDTNSTPLLVAVSIGNLEAVQALIQLGARPDIVDAKNQGVVDICAFKRYMNILEYLAELNHDKLSVWKRLVKLLRSDFDEEVEAASWCLAALTLNCDDEPAGAEATEVAPVTMVPEVSGNKSSTTSSSDLGLPKVMAKWRWAYESGIVPAIAEVLKGTKSELFKLDTLRTMVHIMNHSEIKEQAQSFGIVVALPQLVLSPNKEIILHAARVLKHMAGVRYFAEDACKHNLYVALVETICRHNDPAVLSEVIDACGIIAENSVVMQTSFGETPDSVTTLVRLYEQQASRRVLIALSSSIAKLSSRHVNNQKKFVVAGVLTFLMALTKVKHMNVQLSAVEAIRALLENNKFTQTYVIESDQAKLLLNALGRNTHQTVRDTAARALWIVASFDVEERRKIAELMGIKLFTEFLGTESLNFNLIGAEGLEVLSRSPRIKLSAEEQVSGVQALVGLLNAGKSGAMANVLAALRVMCVAIGYVPRTANQTALVKVNGIVSLMSLIAQSDNTLIQVEAMHTLACVSLGNKEILEEIREATDVMFALHARHLLNDSDAYIRLHIGSALAAFTYNNVQHQAVISSHGGVRFYGFQEFLKSDDEYFRCTAAFQVVVLAPMFVDEQPAIACAAGLKQLVDALQRSQSDSIRALLADYVARLARSRAGVPAALVSVSVVDFLCDLLASHVEQVRGTAAQALGYLSFNHKARRQLLNRCRLAPALEPVVRFYSRDGKLSPDFHDEWKHFTRIGFPRVVEPRGNSTCEELETIPQQ